MKLVLKQFDMSSIEDDKIVVFIGMRGTGKSHLAKDHLYHHKDIPIGTIISPTEGANKFFSKFVPKVFIHENINSKIIQNVLIRQKKVQKQIHKEIAINGKSDIDPRAFLILDDCLYDKKWIKDESIRCLFMNGRHWKISFIITLQDPLGLPPVLRNNIDYVFILRENKISNRRRIYEHYAGMFPKFEMFCNVMDQCTENYECLVIHNSSKSNKIEEQIFWYKAEDRGDFKIGNEAFWNLDNDSDDEDDDDFELPIGKNSLKVKKKFNKKKLKLNN